MEVIPSYCDPKRFNHYEGCEALRRLRLLPPFYITTTSGISVIVGVRRTDFGGGDMGVAVAVAVGDGA